MQHDRCSGKERGTSTETSVTGEPSGRHVLSVGGGSQWGTESGLFPERGNRSR